MTARTRVRNDYHPPLHRHNMDPELGMESCRRAPWCLNGLAVLVSAITRASKTSILHIKILAQGHSLTPRKQIVLFIAQFLIVLWGHLGLSTTEAAVYVGLLWLSFLDDRLQNFFGLRTKVFEATLRSSDTELEYHGHPTLYSPAAYRVHWVPSGASPFLPVVRFRQASPPPPEQQLWQPQVPTPRNLPDPTSPTRFGTTLASNAPKIDSESRQELQNVENHPLATLPLSQEHTPQGLLSTEVPPTQESTDAVAVAENLDPDVSLRSSGDVSRADVIDDISNDYPPAQDDDILQSVADSFEDHDDLPNGTIQEIPWATPLPSQSPVVAFNGPLTISPGSPTSTGDRWSPESPDSTRSAASIARKLHFV